MDEVYRGYRITVKEAEFWNARITEVRGRVVPLKAKADLLEGADVCVARARAEVDRYITFLSGRSGPDA